MERLPIALVMPHGGLAVPPELDGRIALTPTQIFNEADLYVEQLFDFRDRVLYWETFPYARAILDLNRPADSALHHRLGDGVVKRQTSYGDPVFHPRLEPEPALENYLIHHYWQPWHDRLTAIERDERVKLVIDCHSMAAIGPDMYDDPAAIRPFAQVANLGDHRGELYASRPRLSAAPEVARALAAALQAALLDLLPLVPAEPDVPLNRPFWGGWNLWAHGGVHQPWLMIEMNRALYIGAQTAHTRMVPPDEARIALLRERIWQAITTTLQTILEAA
jgi:formiminoglutamase